MTQVRIDWLVDTYDCGQDGCSEGYSEGAKVYFDGELAIDMTPQATCFGGDNYEPCEVYQAVLEKLGHTLVTSYD